MKKQKVTAKAVRDSFEAELRAQGFVFHRKDGAWKLERSDLDGELTVSIDNLVRNAVRDGSLSNVAGFVSRLVPTLLPSWSAARSHVYWSLESSAHDLTNVVHETISPLVSRVLVWVPEDQSVVSWLGAAQLKKWKVKKAEVAKHAERNLDALLKNLAPEVSEIDGQRLGMIPIDGPLKASSLLAPGFRRFIAPIGWPVLATAPCRDFVYVYPNDAMALVQRTAPVVVREFKNSGYALSAEVWRIDDDGMTALGAFDTR